MIIMGFLETLVAKILECKYWSSCTPSRIGISFTFNGGIKGKLLSKFIYNCYNQWKIDKCAPFATHVWFLPKVSTTMYSKEAVIASQRQLLTLLGCSKNGIQKSFQHIMKDIVVQSPFGNSRHIFLDWDFYTMSAYNCIT